MKQDNRGIMGVEYNDKLDIFKHLSSTHVAISKSITSDFIFAKLEPDVRTFIIEMTANAYFSRKILVDYAERAKKRKKVDDMGYSYILTISNDIFDDYMNKIYMTVILHRNVSKNYIIDRLTGIETDKEDELTNETLANTLKKMARPEQNMEIEK